MRVGYINIAEDSTTLLLIAQLMDVRSNLDEVFDPQAICLTTAKLKLIIRALISGWLVDSRHLVDPESGDRVYTCILYCVQLEFARSPVYDYLVNLSRRYYLC